MRPINKEGVEFPLPCKNCPYLIEIAIESRPANALNVEIGKAADRCQIKTPSHWGDADPLGSRWLLSGGSPLVFGWCTPNNCPKTPDELP